MKEIGGYIELDNYMGQEYHESAVAVNSGRHALEYLIKAKNIKKIYLPYFLCSSIRNKCSKCGCAYEMYHIDKNFLPMFDSDLNSNEYLYVVNYYGQIRDEKIKELKQKYQNLIIDNAQDFFRKPIKKIDTIYTCRKYFGVCDGGYVYTDAVISDELKQDVSYSRMNYILGRYEEGANKFYEESALNNKYFDSEELKYMSRLTHNLLRKIDYEEIIRRRNQNFEFLHENFSNINRLILTQPNGAFMYPLLIKNGIDIKKIFIKNKIYVPTLWNDMFELKGYNPLEESFVKDIIPLPIDQRYNIEDMEYIVNLIKEQIDDGTIR